MAKQKMRVWDLSATQMRKRLSAAGLRGSALRKALDDIAALRAARTDYLGLSVLGCDPTALCDLVGSKAYRKLVAWPVMQRFWLLDEGAHYMSSELAEIVQQARSFGCVTQSVVQDLAQPSGAA